MNKLIFCFGIVMSLGACASATEDCVVTSPSVIDLLNEKIYINSSPEYLLSSFTMQSKQDNNYYLVAGELPLADSGEARSVGLAIWVIKNIDQPELILSVSPSAGFYSQFPREETMDFFFFGDENFQKLTQCVLKNWGEDWDG